MDSDRQPQKIDYHWHLSKDDAEVVCTELEFALMRCFESFGRWQSECLASVSATAASGPENALLHIVRMNDRAKSIKELARLTNRDDIPNIQYSMRKLISEELVEKQGSGRTGVTYQVTARGKNVTEDYAAIRKDLLIERISTLPQFDERLKAAGESLNILAGIYEEISRITATHRR